MKTALKFLILSLLVLYNPNSALAANTSQIPDPSYVICNIVNTLSGSISQGIATLVVIITGYSFFVGKVSIGMLLIVVGGIMFVFGAQTILGWIIGDTSFQCVGGKIY